MEFHEIANVFPMLGDAELEALAADIKNNGLRHPVVLFQDKILDGRNRFRACELAGVPAAFEVFDGSWVEACRFVASENVKRRHLSDRERAWCAAKLANLENGQRADSKPGRGGPIGPAVSNAQAAQLLNVPERSVKRARRIQEQAAPELVAAVEQGTVSPAAAEELVRLPEAAQREAVAAGPDAVKQAARQVRGAPTRRLSPAQEQIRARKRADELLYNLVTVIQATRQAVTQFAEDAVTVAADDREAVLLAVTELRSVADWLESLANAGS